MTADSSHELTRSIEWGDGTHGFSLRLANPTGEYVKVSTEVFDSTDRTNFDASGPYTPDSDQGDSAEISVEGRVSAGLPPEKQIALSGELANFILNTAAAAKE